MNNIKFDLLTEHWIPVTTPDGGLIEIGIREALLNAHLLGEMQSNSALITTAQLRLLLAIIYCACGPEDADEWAEMWKGGMFPEQRINSYLDRWSDRFDLCSETLPFMQTPYLTMKEANSLAQLITEASCGNNATLFDHTLDETPPTYTLAHAAQRLVAAQAFSIGFGKAGSAIICDKVMERPYLADAICLRGVSIWFSGKNLFEMLMLNLVPCSKENVGMPAWEYDDPFSTLDQIKNGKRASKDAKGVADRYSWMSRMIRLVIDTNGTVKKAYFTQGREADKKPGDPMKVFVESKEAGIYACGLNAEKASWRDLNAYLGYGNHPNPIIQHTARQVDDEVLDRSYMFSLNVVGLATDPGKAAKLLLWRHDRMILPSELLRDRNAVEKMRIALSDAEFVGRAIGKRIYRISWLFLPPEGNPDTKDVKNLSEAIDPRSTYWARLETHFAEFLLNLIDDQNGALDTWRNWVEKEARDAFQGACDRLGANERAIKAVAQVPTTFSANEAEVGLNILAAKKKPKNASKKE